MDPTPLIDIARWTGGALAGDASDVASTVCTDSRALAEGDLFVALRGENFDGHTFIAEAARRGAVGAIGEEFPSNLLPGFTSIRVPDALHALQQMAAEYRRGLPIKVIGITGSNGKTSTKDLTASVLAERYEVTRTAGNLNNHIGLPLTVLRASKRHQIGIFEMGMNHPGEIAPLAAIAAPDVAIITNVGVAHIEHMGSREAIALEKGMLAEALKLSGHLILCAEDDFSTSIATRTDAEVIYCGIEKGRVQARNLRPYFNGVRFTIEADGQQCEAELPVPGTHFVQNAMLAVAAARVFGVSLEECAAGLRKLQLTKGRMEQKISRGIHILDDTYNANPDSMEAAIRTLSQLPSAGRRIAVLGRMGELGAEAEKGHRRVGTAAASVGVDCVIGVGEDACWITDAARCGGVEKVAHFAEVEEAVAMLRDFAEAGDVVLVKGSRSSRMERIVEGLNT